jgi:hypothetical protein
MNRGRSSGRAALTLLPSLRSLMSRHDTSLAILTSETRVCPISRVETARSWCAMSAKGQKQKCHPVGVMSDVSPEGGHPSDLS